MRQHSLAAWKAVLSFPQAVQNSLRASAPREPRARRNKANRRTCAAIKEDNMAMQIPRDFRRVIVAASVGNVIEWYDFYIFGSLAAVLSVKFFEKSHPVAALLSTVALFTAGFLIRPLGAFLFGWMGDRVGRKYTFLVTLSGIGICTGCIGLVATFQGIRLTAASLRLFRRMTQW